jgi:outer membrane murein-binding lipoprotein Lpp
VICGKANATESPSPRPCPSEGRGGRHVALVAVLVLAGCAPTRMGATKSMDQSLNDLRAQNQELHEKVAELQRNIDLRLAEIDTLQQRVNATQPTVPGVKPQDLPRAVKVEFGRYTGTLDTDQNGGDDLIRAYVHTLDQHDRFIPITGQATLQAVVISPGAAPALLVEKTWPVRDLQNAYVSGIFGTHYTLEMPLPRDLPAGIPADLTIVTLKLTILDAASGAKMTCEQATPLRLKR